MLVDLHGYPIHEAWRKVGVMVDESYHRGDKKMTVITGKGVILDEFPSWCDNNPRIRKIILRKDGGSFVLNLRKK